MAQHIFGARNKIHIMNLEATLPALEAALDEGDLAPLREGGVIGDAARFG